MKQSTLKAIKISEQIREFNTVLKGCFPHQTAERMESDFAHANLEEDAFEFLLNADYLSLPYDNARYIDEEAFNLSITEIENIIMEMDEMVA